MNCRRRVGLGAILGILAVVATAAPPVQFWRLDNGARVLFIESRDLPIVDARLIFDAGAARDGESSGIARLTNAVLAEGAGGLNAAQLGIRFEQVGAQFGAESLRDMAVFELRMLAKPDSVRRAADTLAIIVGQPDFPADAIERQRNRMLTDLKNKAQSPGRLAQAALMKALYGDHPYGAPPHGTPASLAGIDAQRLRAFHSGFYVGSNVVVAIVGDLDADGAVRLAERLTRHLPVGRRAPRLPAVPVRTESRTLHIPYDATQATVVMGRLGIAHNEADYFSLVVGNHILGGSGMVSLLFDTVREQQGLAYSVGSALTPMAAVGPFIVSAATRHTQSDQALNLLRDTVRAFVADGPSDAQVAAALQNLTGRFPLSMASNAALVGRLGVIGFYGLPLDYLDRYVPRIARETRDTVHAAVRRVLPPSAWVPVIVGPESGAGAHRAASAGRDNRQGRCMRCGG